jgi:DNA helicase IV
VAHPDLPLEQKYVDHAYDCLEKKIAVRKGLQQNGVAAHPRQQFALNKALREGVEALDPSGQILYGRCDDTSGDTLYVGKHYLEDPENRTVVSVSWKSNAAQPFFQADAEDPMGLVLRRRFVAEDRVLLDLYDEWFDELAKQLAEGSYVLPDPPVLGEDALLLDLESRRTGEMREIVATIQAEQDRAIRAPMDGIFVIQGGPGTGKSAVGLHRAAVLMFQHEELRNEGVLVVGPNPAFMRYIEKVLPSLGESEVRQESITRLGPAVRPERIEAPKAEKVKGDARMAQVLRNALFARVRPAEQSLALPGATIVVSEAVVRGLIAEAQSRSTFDAARRAFGDRFVGHVLAKYRQARGTSISELGTSPELLRQHAEVGRALDRLWSTVTSREAHRDLLSSRNRIADSSDGILDADEQALLLRDRAASLNAEKWSYADLPLLDELEFLLHGERPSYAHVIVDEAQDLSPMQLRMIARRSPRQSFTLLGDLAQATGHWTDRTWEDIAGQLAPEAPMRLYELSLGYRVPAEVMDYASRLLPFIAPDLAQPRAVRTWAGPIFVSVEKEHLLSTAVETARSHASQGRSSALIVPDDLLAATLEALRESGVAFGEAAREDLSKPITVVPGRLAKGLEFEAVVVVEPADIKDLGEDGLRVLYVALTRTTADLVLVHADRLPPELQEPASTAASDFTTETVPVMGPVNSGPDTAAVHENTDELWGKIGDLSERDRELLAAVVKWMQAGPDAGL